MSLQPNKFAFAMDYSNSTAENITDSIDRSFKSSIPYWAVVLRHVIFWIIDIIGITGNCMIIIAVALSQKLQTSTNVFVTSLALTDLLTCLTLAIGYISLASLPLTSPQLNKICQFVAFVTYSSVGTSLYTLAAIGINRLILITKPIQGRRIFTPWKHGIYVAILWIVPIGIIVIALLNGVGAVGLDPVDNECSKVNTHERASDLDLIMFAAGLPIPFTVITVSYTWIYIYIKKHFKTQKRHLRSTIPISSDSCNTCNNTLSKNTLDQQDFSSKIKNQSVTTAEQESGKKRAASADASEESMASEADIRVSTNPRIKEISQQQIQITKNLFLVVCVFFICFGPIGFVLLVGKPSPIVAYIAWCLHLLALINSAINFFIYASKHPDFKIVLGHMIRCSYSKIPQPSRLLKFLLSKKN